MMDEESPWRRLRRLFRRDPEAEVDEELRFHLEQRVRDYLSRGTDPESARRAALKRLGNLERVRNECTDILAAERWWSSSLSVCRRSAFCSSPPPASLSRARRALAVQPTEVLRD